jgi:hypothetical protein
VAPRRQRLAWPAVAESNTGSWVRRVGASGGGKAYRRRRPINFYGVLVIVIVLGLSSVAYARHLYRNPGSNANAIPPTTSMTWYAALGINACGVQQPALAPNPGATLSFTAIANGAIQVAPKTAADTGHNATLGKFVSTYPGLTVTPTKLAVPGATGKATPATTWVAGEKCAAGTKYAGKTAFPLIAYWSSVGSSSPSVASDPSNVQFSPNMLITLYYGPKGVTPPRPPQSAINAMLNGPTTPTTTTTTTTIPSTTLP